MSAFVNIPLNKTLPMALRSNNNKSVKSPPLKDDISINSIYIYNYVLQNLQSKNYTESYNVLMQLKTIIRCVWRTYYNYADYPNINYLKDIYYNHSAKLIKPFMRPVDIIIKKFQKEFNSEDFIILERSLIPYFKYSLSMFNDNTVWDKYLVIFDNILLSENIEVRKELKNERDRKYNELAEEFDDKTLYPNGRKSEEYIKNMARITNEYKQNIENNKEQLIFNVVNYLNWMYYNGTKTDKEFALKVVLLRYCCFDNDSNYCEIYIHDKDKYKSHIKKLYHQYIKTNANETLLKLYLSINIYKYQFGHKNISLYDSEYVSLMLNYSLNTLITLQDYVNSMYEEPNKYLNLLRLMFDDKDILQTLINKYFVDYSFRTRKLYEFINEKFAKDIIASLKVEEIFIKISSKKTITTLFNKLTNKNKQNIYEELAKYEINNIINTFTEMYICNNSYGPFTHIALEYILNSIQNDNEKLQRFKENILNTISNNSKELLGLLTAYFNDIKFYGLVSNTNDKADVINSIILYVNQLNNETKRYLINDINNCKDTAKGYAAFLFDNALDKLII